jgi:hypothetical protein
LRRLDLVDARLNRRGIKAERGREAQAQVRRRCTASMQLQAGKGTDKLFTVSSRSKQSAHPCFYTLLRLGVGSGEVSGVVKTSARERKVEALQKDEREQHRELR